MNSPAPIVALPDSLFEGDHVLRPFSWDGGGWGFVLARFKAHGFSPDACRRLTTDWFAVNIVLRGRGTFIDSTGKELPLYPGVLFQRLPGLMQTSEPAPSSDYAEFFLVFDPHTSEGLVSAGLIEPKEWIDIGIGPEVLEECRLLATTLSQLSERAPRSQLVMHAMRFLHAQYERASSPASDAYWQHIAQQASERLESDLAKPLDMAKLARSLKVSYSSFRRHFRRLRGVSPMEYRIKARVHAACRLLASHPVKDTAEALGYCDPFSFSAQFKRHTGTAPAVFRRRLREHAKPGP